MREDFFSEIRQRCRALLKSIERHHEAREAAIESLRTLRSFQEREAALMRSLQELLDLPTDRQVSESIDNCSGQLPLIDVPPRSNGHPRRKRAVPYTLDGLEDGRITLTDESQITPLARDVLKFLRREKPTVDAPLSSPAIVAAMELDVKPNVFRKHIVPQLQPFGVKATHNGYYVD